MRILGLLVFEIFITKNLSDIMMSFLGTIMKRMGRYAPLLFSSLLFFFFEDAASAQDLAGSGLEMAEEVRDMPVSSTIRLLFVLSAMTFIPAVMLAMTPFTRFIIVFSMLRQAIGLQQAPPNQVLVGLSLMLSLMIMHNPLTEAYEQGLEPFMNGEMETFDAVDAAMKPMRGFMLSNTRRDDLQTMMDIGNIGEVETLDDIPSTIVICSFVLSELKTAFVIGVRIYLPFLVVDIIIANILLGMGMLVLPPVVISLPFKIMLFVLMDGWSLLIRSMTASFYGV